MYKFTILFTSPADFESFETFWAYDFIPFAEKMPELQRIEVSTIMGAPDGQSPFYKMHEFYFADREALDRALNSDMGMRAGYALQKLPSGSYKLFFADAQEMFMA